MEKSADRIVTNRTVYFFAGKWNAKVIIIIIIIIIIIQKQKLSLNFTSTIIILLMLLFKIDFVLPLFYVFYCLLFAYFSNAAALSL